MLYREMRWSIDPAGRTITPARPAVILSCNTPHTVQVSLYVEDTRGRAYGQILSQHHHSSGSETSRAARHILLAFPRFFVLKPTARRRQTTGQSARSLLSLRACFAFALRCCARSIDRAVTLCLPHMLRSVAGANSSRGIAAVVGVGPRLGSAVARKFASEGYTVAILSRDLGKLDLPLLLPPPPFLHDGRWWWMWLCTLVQRSCRSWRRRSRRRRWRRCSRCGWTAPTRGPCARPSKGCSRSAPSRCSSTTPASHPPTATATPPRARLPSSPSPPTPSTAPSPSPPPAPSTAPTKYNPSIHISPLDHIFAGHWSIKQVIPGMVERGRGTVIFTGSSASVTGYAGYSDLSKLIHSLARSITRN